MMPFTESPKCSKCGSDHFFIGYKRARIAGGVHGPEHKTVDWLLLTCSVCGWMFRMVCEDNGGDYDFSPDAINLGYPSDNPNVCEKESDNE